MSGNPPRLMKAPELARRLGISVPTLHKWRRDGILPGPMQGTVFYDWDKVKRMLDTRSGLAAPSPAGGEANPWVEEGDGEGRVQGRPHRQEAAG